MVETVWVYNSKPSDVRELIKTAGNTIGSVHFLKRKDGSLRKMAYRLHVTNPTTAKAPVGTSHSGVDTSDTTIALGDSNQIVPVKGPVRADGSYSVVMNFGRGFGPNRKDVDNANNQMTVLDCSKTVRDSSGKVIGRGQWRTIPLEGVVQITVKGTKYLIKR